MAQDIILSYPTKEIVAEQVAKAFLAYTTKVIEETESCVVAVSGGTTPNLLFEILNSEDYVSRVDWENIFFLWVDERFVPHNNPDSNFCRAKERLFGNIGGSCHYYPIPTDEGTVEEAATAYEKEVKMVLKASGKTGLDLCLLGLGDDGHTASLFPRSRALKEKERYIVPVQDGKVWDRVSMSFPFLATAKEVWFTVVGESKRAALAKVLSQRLAYEDDSWEDRIGHVLPGAVLSQSPMYWYVDEDACKPGAISQK